MGKARVLIVDDRSELREKLRDVLEDQGYLIRTAGDGREAMEHAKVSNFNLALIDLILPDMSGLDVMRGIRRISPNLVVIFITGYASVETAVRAIRQGAYDYISKPFDATEIIATIERGLEKQRLAAENERLLESLKEKTKKLEKFYLGSMTALAATIDARNCNTKLHSEQVTKYSLGIARKQGLSEMEMHNLEQACRLHDIGKIAIPDSILTKAGGLTADEWEVVKKHPARGAKILDSSGFLNDIVPLVKHHHERFDGSGYPDHLCGDAIPLGARIIAVADAFEAMTATRSYRTALHPDVALVELSNHTGTQFDPGLEGLFIDAWREDAGGHWGRSTKYIT